ncbi:BspA family leucine-rich repeat surface protein, partial [Reichenbachiella agariperforans]|uniref:BspA family leucine-rich repeat surface protein n=1 Tax=Reichenbachiella agariperforans TaxID=156994 RepID=UPI001C083F2A
MKNSFLSIVLSLMLFQPLLAQEDFQPFVSSWKLSAIDESVTIALNTNFTYDFTYAWVHEGDTISDGAHQSVDGDFATVFSAGDFSAFGLTEPDTVELYIAGAFPHLTGYSKSQLVDVNQWGDIVWGSFDQTFANWGGSTFSAIDAPILSSDGVSFFRIFRQSGSFNGDLNHWDVSNVNKFNEAFQSARSFNSDLSSWDLTGVDNFGNSFNGANKFEGHGLSQWDISNASRFNGTFNSTSISTATYDDILISWAAQEVKRGVDFGIGNIEVCSTEAEVARERLVKDFNWTITDGGTCDQATNILSFKLSEGQVDEAMIDYSNHTIELGVLSEVDVTTLLPVLTLSEGAISDPESGVLQDFTNAVTYTITAEDGSTLQDWTVSMSVTSQRPFITSWSVTAEEDITIGLNDDLLYDFSYIWKDDEGNVTDFGSHRSEDGDFSTVFSETGTYTLEVFGGFSHLTGNYPKDQLLDVLQWGDIVWESFYQSFNEWPGADFSTTDLPDLSQVDDMSQMFFQATNFNGDLSAWDVSKVTNMSRMFENAESFSEGLNNWDVSQVINMSRMFFGTSVFNSDLSLWNVGSVTNMSSMFENASVFDGHLRDWDVSSVTNMSRMFENAENFNEDLSNWDVSQVINMSRMFFGTSVFNSDLSLWNVGSVTNMSSMFENASIFDSDLSDWDVSSVTNMSSMFDNASTFDSNLSDWDVSQVTTFESTFRNATAFNGNVDNWQVNEATNMFLMFSGAENFNQDISGWQTGNVTDMRDMFSNAQAFNQDISQWDVSKVTNLSQMFKNATVFNSDLSSWEIGAVTDMGEMFSNSGLSPQNYDKALMAWSAQEVHDNVSLDAEDITFCKGAEARQALIDDHGWTIGDDGQFCSSETDILSLAMLNFNKSASVNTTNHTLRIVLPQNTDVSVLQPLMTLSPGATTSPANEEVVDFTDPVTITVTAEDGTTTQDWIVTVNVVPSNDFCSDAITVTIGETVSGNTTFASNDAAVASSCGNNEVRNDNDGENGGISVGVWYKLVGNGETITLNTCTGDKYDFDDTSLSVYTGSCTTGLVCLAGNEDGEQAECGGDGYLARLSFNSVLDEEYFVLVDGYGDAKGEFDLITSSVPTTPPPANDNCSGAEVLTVFAEGTGTPTNGTNAHATAFTQTQECDQYGTINDVWYRFNSGTNVEVSVTVALTDTDADGPLVVAESIQIDGYETCGGESLDICEREGTFTMDVEPNTDYKLQLWNGIDEEGTFTIQINDGSNTAATVEDAEVSMSRFSTNGSLVETVIASDEEGHKQLYSITAGNEEGIFAIDEVTGGITVIDETVLQASATTSFELTIQAADQGPGALTSTGIVTINIVDNEFPVIADQEITLDENSANGTVVIQVVATDDDGMDFAIIGGNTGSAFEMSSTGEITVNASEQLNFEEQSVFVLEIEVTDQDLELPLASSAKVTINLNDVNESPEVSDVSFNISDVSPNGLVIGTIDFTDEDADQSHTFAITVGNDDSIFGIDETTGVLTVADNGNLVTDTDYSLTVVVTDNGNPTRSGSATVGISSFTNTPPVIAQQFFSLEENTANGTVVAVVQATDDDENELLFSIVGGSGRDVFSIDTDGELQVADQSVLDFETQSSFDLRVRVTDDGIGELFNEEIITINLTDVNEAPIADDLRLNMSAFVQNGHVLGTVLAADPENDVLTYTILSGNEEGAFAVGPNTGVAAVIDASQINVENTPRYDLEVEVSDGRLSTIISVEVFVFVNQFPSLLATEFDIDENSLLGSVIGTLESDDTDGIDSFEIISVSEEGLVSLDSETGEITLGGNGDAVGAFSLDYESIQEVVLQVRITDKGIGALETIETVTIVVNDVNEFAPFVSNVEINDLEENASEGTEVATVTASDEDSFQTLTYAIIGGDTGGAFAISNEGSITVNTSSVLDFETSPSFILTVEVSDSGEPARVVEQEITVALTDVNEAPELTAIGAQTGRVGEELSFTASALDVDLPANTLVYSIDSNSEDKGMNIDASTGVLSWTASSEQAGGHSVEILVSDGEFSDSEIVAITIHSIATEVLTFVLTDQTGAATINTTDHTVAIEVAFGTDVSALSPEFTLSSGATSDPVSGTAVDFSSAVTYTVTAEDGTTIQDWVVTVTEAANTSTDILTFVLADQTGAAVIDAADHTVSIEVPFGTDVTGLIPTLTLSEGAISNPASGSSVDFTESVTYTVTAEDGVTIQDWLVTVTVDSEDPDTDTDILTFELSEQTGAATINTTDHTVSIEVPFGTDVTGLTPTLTLSEGAISNPA